MQAILAELGALMGVNGSFVCDRDGGLVGRAMPDGVTNAGLAAIGRSLMQTLNGTRGRSAQAAVRTGFRLCQRNDAGEEPGGRLPVRPVCPPGERGHGQHDRQHGGAQAEGSAVRFRGRAGRCGSGCGAVCPAPAAAAPAAAPPVPAPVAAPVASATGGPPLDTALVSQIEHELARAVGPVAMFAVDDAAAAMGFTRQTLPAISAAAWIERLGGEIADAGKKAHFLQAARQIARVG